MNDEINNLIEWEDDEWESSDKEIEKYFDEMELDENEKEKRKDFSKKFIRFILPILVLIYVAKKHDREKSIKQIRNGYKGILTEYMEVDDFIDDHISQFSEDIIDTTILNIDDEYFTSEMRALLISVNEANTDFNYNQYINAIESGKKFKIWRTEKDKRVRKTHKALDDKQIPIMNVFKVGKTYMRFAHDTLFGVDYAELSNCRCTTEYK